QRKSCDTPQYRKLFINTNVFLVVIGLITPQTKNLVFYVKKYLMKYRPLSNYSAYKGYKHRASSLVPLPVRKK
ncbi:MAG: hypothetical protein ACTSPJ_09825, partial [Candidatus Heimdallarchaeaceae archaeon]